MHARATGAERLDNGSAVPIFVWQESNCSFGTQVVNSYIKCTGNWKEFKMRDITFIKNDKSVAASRDRYPDRQIGKLQVLCP